MLRAIFTKLYLGTKITVVPNKTPNPHFWKSLFDCGEIWHAYPGGVNSAFDSERTTLIALGPRARLRNARKKSYYI